jgi:hypothetical protein
VLFKIWGEILTFCLHFTLEAASKALRNVGILPQIYTVTQPRRTRLESSAIGKPQIYYLELMFLQCLAHHISHTGTNPVFLRWREHNIGTAQRMSRIDIFATILHLPCEAQSNRVDSF